jgi:uncharacterized protein
MSRVARVRLATNVGCIMSRQLFVNLPVKNLDRSVQFFKKLGFTFDPKFTDENATCMNVGEDAFVMLLVEKFFRTFTPKSLADPSRSTEVLVAISAESRDAVNQLVNTAIEAGGRHYKQPDDMGFMYGWGFEDPDGHLWEVVWMDSAALERSEVESVDTEVSTLPPG